MSKVTWYSEIYIESKCLFTFALMGWLLHYIYSLHAVYFYISRNWTNTENQWTTFFLLIDKRFWNYLSIVRIYHIFTYIQKKNMLIWKLVFKNLFLQIYKNQIVVLILSRVRPLICRYTWSIKEKEQRPYNVWLRIRIMCQGGAKCLPTDCCFSELNL